MDFIVLEMRQSSLAHFFVSRPRRSFQMLADGYLVPRYLASSPAWPRSRKQAHESGSRQVRREEMLVFETGGAGQRLGRQITAANGAFHRCRPACCCPVTCKEYARP